MHAEVRQAAALVRKPAAGGTALDGVRLSAAVTSASVAAAQAPGHTLHAPGLKHAPALQRFLSDLGELANVESGPLMQGRQMIMVVGPQKTQVQA